jgi:hypothetical protein
MTGPHTKADPQIAREKVSRLAEQGCPADQVRRIQKIVLGPALSLGNLDTEHVVIPLQKSV